MPWVRGNLTQPQYNLITALILLENDKEGSQTEENNEFFNKKLEEARQKNLEKKKEIEKRIYNSNDKSSVVKESHNILAQQLLNKNPR